MIREWELDHDHEADRIRGHICRRCNFLLGVAGDSPALLQRAAEYLEKPPRSGSYLAAVRKRHNAWAASPEQRAKRTARNARYRERQREKKRAAEAA